MPRARPPDLPPPNKLQNRSTIPVPAVAGEFQSALVVETLLGAALGLTVIWSVVDAKSRVAAFAVPLAATLGLASTGWWGSR